ncbi:MAG: DUF5666 domain-containing protein [Blastocatellia bacterium]
MFAILVLVLGLMPTIPSFAADAASNNVLELHGTISKLPATPNLVGDWTVGGKVIHVSATTILQQEAGKAAVGAYVEIKGTPNNDGSLNATKIEVQLSGSPADGNEVEFIGNIEELPSTTGRIGDWKVAGKVVHVSATTQIEQERVAVATGVTVKIEGIRQSDGSINALEIATAAPPTGAGSEARFWARLKNCPARRDASAIGKSAGASSTLRPKRKSIRAMQRLPLARLSKLQDSRWLTVP